MPDSSRRQLGFADVRGDVAGDFFRAELGVAGDDRQFLDVDRGEAVFGTTRSEIRIESRSCSRSRA